MDTLTFFRSTYKDRFWSNVDIRLKSQCWYWKGKPNNSGYSRINILGIIYLAHRVSWTLANGLFQMEL